MGIIVALGIIVGVRLAIADLPLYAVFLMVGLLVIVVITTSTARALALCLMVSTAIGMAAGYRNQPEPVPPYVGRVQITTSAQVTSDPKQTSRGLSATVRWVDTHGVSRTSRLYADAHPRFHRGDEINVAARVRGLDADYLYASSVTVAQRATGLEASRARLRDWLDRTIRQRIGGSEGALALGLINGDDSAMTTRDADAVRHAGLSHITAVSGWNVTLVVASVGALVLALGRRGRMWVSAEILALAAYVWLVGSDAPVVRAAIMAGFVIVARQLGRPAHGPTLIALAAALMIAADPAAFSSLSFQLSILATAALILSLRLTSRYRGLAAVIIAPVAATSIIALVTAPALAASTGTFSLASIPANVAAGSLVVLAASATILLVATSWIPIVATAFAFLTWVLTHAILWIAALFARLPGGFIEFRQMDGAMLRLAMTLLTLTALLALPEGRFGFWQLQRWNQQDARIAPVACTSFALATVALIVVTF
ncbi:MAG: ComEC/Rec2 family competence protein [Thermomicrobiales bacterium]|nr:ComEC/Rec2 family competence protein [Thermomicrobiales bacterium]